MFVFAIFATVVAVGFVYGLVTDISNGGGLGEEAPENYTTTTDTTTTTSNVSTKANLTPNGEKIIGLRDASLIKNSSELTTTTFDTTTYGDRAILKLTNETVYTATLTGLAIRGKVVLQQSGKNGYVWEYSDYDAIEKEGESFVEVSNDYIFDPVQAKSIGDFVWKELKPHKLYTLQLIGCHYEYEIGDIWHVTLEYTLNNGTMENIDTDVEIMGSSMSRSVGELGITTLNLRVPSSAWELTLAKNAKLVGAGTSKRLNNRSNVVTVASSTWTGQADYFCDGTNDEVEIQAAIDYLSKIGGGQVLLTLGTFNLTEAHDTTYAGDAAKYSIAVYSNIKISGAGPFTILNYDNNATYSFAFMCESGTSNIAFSNFSSVFENAALSGRFIWSGMCDGVYIDGISSNANLLSHAHNKTTTALPSGICNIVNCECQSILGSYINASNCNFTAITLLSYCNITSCNVGKAFEIAISVYGSYNTITGCNIQATLIAVQFYSASSYNTLVSCTRDGSISDSGTGNVKANNAP